LKHTTSHSQTECPEQVGLKSPRDYPPLRQPYTNTGAKQASTLTD